MSDAAKSPMERFSDRVENYVRHRPGYPPQILGVLQSHAGLRGGAVVADIGSGTGISTELLLRTGATVMAVEPNAAMRGAAERKLLGFTGFCSVEGSAQETTLFADTVDLVTAFQAFHWFNTPETRTEFSRILKPEGKIALVWNERRLESTNFLKEYESLLLRLGTDYTVTRHENIDHAALDSFFDGPWERWSFPYLQPFDYAGLEGRLLSSSYAPLAGHPAHLPMLEELKDIFERHQEDGKVIFEYDTVLYLGK